MFIITKNRPYSHGGKKWNAEIFRISFIANFILQISISSI